jgi:SpoVK/Ycf46/Vps4 family AAA+-type ATPase
LVRAVVNAVGDGVTVLVPSMEAVAQSLSSVYQAAARLSPSIVVLEDIDVVTRDRRGGASASLMGFLNALDGVLVDRETVVVTIATSNNPDGMDDAAKRPGRIDRFIHVANPDDAAREMILEKNLRRLEEAGATVSVTKDCVSSIVAAAKGRSGAVLKEIVRRALLLGSATSAAVGDAELRAAALDVGIETASDPRHGTYL